MTLTMGMLASARRASTYTYNGTYNPTTSGTSFTYTAAPLGTAASTRLIVVVITTRGGGTTTISSVTLGGSAMTKAVETSSTNDDAFIYYLASSSGTTADIVATFTTSQAACTISTYSLYNLTSNTPNATGSGLTGTATISAAANDIVIAGATKRGVSANTWTNVTSDFAAAAGSTGSYTSHGSKKQTASISSVVSTLDQISAAAWR